MRWSFWPQMQQFVEMETKSYSIWHHAQIQKADQEAWPKFEADGTEVTVLVEPAQYDDFAAELRKRGGTIGLESRRRFAHEAFERVSRYDNAISDYFAGSEPETSIADAVKSMRLAEMFVANVI